MRSAAGLQIETRSTNHWLVVGHCFRLVSTRVQLEGAERGRQARSDSRAGDRRQLQYAHRSQAELGLHHSSSGHAKPNRGASHSASHSAHCSAPHSASHSGPHSIVCAQRNIRIFEQLQKQLSTGGGPSMARAVKKHPAIGVQYTALRAPDHMRCSVPAPVAPTPSLHEAHVLHAWPWCI